MTTFKTKYKRTTLVWRPNFPILRPLESPLHINDALSKGIQFLHDHQLPNGQFTAYMAADAPMQGWTLPMDMIFPTALICQSLIHIKEDEKVETMLKKSTDFLQYQIGRGATWNHFAYSESIRRVCPQDIDDTACVSHFLIERNTGFKKEANKKLILDNKNSQGLLYTWFTFRWRFNANKTYWRLAATELKSPIRSYFFWNEEARRSDIDTVVNANVLHYLGDIPEMQPVIDHIIDTINKNQEHDCDKWYRNLFSVYYFFTRCYFAGIKKLLPIVEPIKERIIQQAKENGQIGNTPLDTALAACSLINLGYTGPVLTNAIHYLTTTQEQHGGWPRQLLYYGGRKKLSGYGSEELVTGFCVEALARYNN